MFYTFIIFVVNNFQKNKKKTYLSIYTIIFISVSALLFFSCNSKKKANIDVFSVDWNTIVEASEGTTVYF